MDMKLTVKQLRQIIKEEVSKAMGKSTFADVVAAAGVDFNDDYVLKSPIDKVEVQPLRSGEYMVTSHVKSHPYYIRVSAADGKLLASALAQLNPGGLSMGSSSPESDSGDMDVSGPNVTIDAGDDSYDLDWPSDVEGFKTALQGVIQWLSSLPPTTTLDFNAANGMDLVAEDASGDEVDDISIKWSRKAGPMSKKFSKVLAFVSKNAVNVIHCDID